MPDTGKTCSFPDLPILTYSHTMDTLANIPIICGGVDSYATQTSCIQLTPTSASGNWTNYATTRNIRYAHTSWVSGAGLVLMGYSTITTEIVPSGGGNFSLTQYTK